MKQKRNRLLEHMVERCKPKPRAGTWISTKLSHNPTDPITKFSIWVSSVLPLKLCHAFGCCILTELNRHRKVDCLICKKSPRIDTGHCCSSNSSFRGQTRLGNPEKYRIFFRKILKSCYLHYEDFYKKPKARQRRSKSKFRKTGTQQPLPRMFEDKSDISALTSKTTMSKDGKAFKKGCIPR